jgi:ArsR family transcriptional regulator
MCFILLPEGGFILGVNYADYTGFFRVLSDENRLKIMDMLSSCGEICACDLLAKLKITQSTLSHHMKILCDCKLVNSRRAGKRTYYFLNETTFRSMEAFIHAIISKKEDWLNRVLSFQGVEHVPMY